jgi:hypothetical protein
VTRGKVRGHGGKYSRFALEKLRRPGEEGKEAQFRVEGQPLVFSQEAYESRRPFSGNPKIS